MKKNQFIIVTEKEQKLFENLSGQKETLLLVFCNEVTEEGEDFLEYYFTYNDSTVENFGLETFYAKVQKTSKKNITKNDLISKAVSRLTEKMVKRNLSNIEDLDQVIVTSSGSNLESKTTVKEGHFINYKGKEIPYDESSQATYLFDCKNKGTIDSNTNKITNLEKIDSKGSFCCILNNGAEYFILTAGHNLQNGSQYKLIRDAKNFVELKKEIDYRNTYDAAILRINKITEGGKVVYDVTDKNPDNKKIENSRDFYENAIKFGNNYYLKEEDAKSKIGFLCGYNSNKGIAEKFEGGVDYSPANQVTEESVTGRFFQISTSTIGGDSGCVLFTKVNETNKLLGIYLGDRGDSDATPKKGRCRPYYSLEKSYKIV